MDLQKNSLLFFLMCFGVSVAYGQRTDKVLPAEKIINLVPDRIKGFSQFANPKARQTKLGDITYSLCEKVYSSDKKIIKVLLFDYKEATIMYQQAMRELANRQTIESDTIIFRAMNLTEGKAWEGYSANNNSSQIFMGINERFYLVISAEKTDLESLENFLLLIPIKDFPR
jgi:hypothetical protein